jgi:hypothetical protein
MKLQDLVVWFFFKFGFMAGSISFFFQTGWEPWLYSRTGRSIFLEPWLTNPKNHRDNRQNFFF